MTPGRPYASWQAPATRVLQELASSHPDGQFPPLQGGRILRSVADELGVPNHSLGELAERIGVWGGSRAVALAVQESTIEADCEARIEALELMAREIRG